jgi:hypothetical protein
VKDFFLYSVSCGGGAENERIDWEYIWHVRFIIDPPPRQYFSTQTAPIFGTFHFKKFNFFLSRRISSCNFKRIPTLKSNITKRVNQIYKMFIL